MREYRLTRKMKEILKSQGYNPEHWHYLAHTSFALVVIHKETKERKTFLLAG